MSYIARTPESFEGKEVGNGQCVAFVKAASGAPASSTWKKGEAVLGNVRLDAGTAIACGWDDHDRYPNARTGNHAAIYISQIGDQIEVWDQWSGEKVKRRWKTAKADRPYHVVE
jgi:hypothetical protein